ncbi:MAG TPA: hypothetical protein VFJ43_13825, partial [Bacteroidia bacterium]|nr:hypothetical protein [Bacteroidia bacterium]
NTTGANNLFIGYQAGQINTTAGNNTFIGTQAGQANAVGGAGNSFVGYFAGGSNTTGYGNVFFGQDAGGVNTTGIDNTYVGNLAAYSNTTGSSNTFLGDEAGNDNISGSGNVFLGFNAGYSELGSNKLYIANSATNPPLIYGDFATARLGLGTTAPVAKLDVSGTAKIGTNGTVLTNVIKAIVSTDVASVPAGGAVTQTYAVANAVVGSAVYISPDLALANGLVIAYARVSAANTVEVKFVNGTAAAIDPPLMNYNIAVIQ